MSSYERDTFERLRQLIAEACAVSPDVVVPQARLRGYGIDSVRIMNLILTIEEAFAVHFDLEELDGVRTVGDLAAYVDRLARTAPARDVAPKGSE